jgi:hypothetical protein
MTDWFAVVDTARSLGAGLDLEMPGPGRALRATAVEAVNGGLVDESSLLGERGRPNRVRDASRGPWDSGDRASGDRK